MPISQIILASGSGGGGGFAGTPSPGSGTYQGSWPGSEFLAAQGTPYDPGGGIATIPNATWGWRRTTRRGIWSNIGSAGNNNPSLFNSPEIDATYDNFGGFGNTTQEDNYACEWKGYFRAPLTATYNWLTDSDDVCLFWIGTAALDPDNNTRLCASNNGSNLNSNSVILTADTWYPIRMRYQEWTGGERCQVYVMNVGTSNALLAMNSWQSNMGWNTGTNGY